MPTHILVQLPALIDGGFLTSLNIYISLPGHLRLLAPNGRNVGNLKAAIRCLKKFSFKTRYSNFMNTPSLSNLELDFRSVAGDAPEPGLLATLKYPSCNTVSILRRPLRSRRFPSLKEVHLLRLPIHLHEIEHLARQFYRHKINHLVTKGDHISFMIDGCYLLSSTWEEAIDVLQDLSGHHNLFESVRIRIAITHPLGGEPHDIGSDVWVNMFYNKPPKLNAVQEYIRWGTVEKHLINPIKAWRDAPPPDINDDGEEDEG